MLETCLRWFWKFKKLKIVLAGVALHFDLDEILHTCPSKQEKSHCLHEHPPFPSLVPGVPGVLMSLETTTRAICLKRYSFINFLLVSFKITTNMHVHLEQDASSATFSEQLLENGKEKVPIVTVTKCISFPSNFCTIVPSTEQLIQNMFPQIATNCENHERLCERAILAEKNNDVNAINNIIQGQI